MNRRTFHRYLGLATLSAGMGACRSPRETINPENISRIKPPRLKRGDTIGHISDQCTLPVGVEAELDAGKGTLTLLESGVS